MIRKLGTPKKESFGAVQVITHTVKRDDGVVGKYIEEFKPTKLGPCIDRWFEWPSHPEVAEAEPVPET